MSEAGSSLRDAVRQMLSTRHGKILFCLAGILLAALIFYIQMSGEIGPLLPGRSRIDALNRELKKLRAQEAELAGQSEARDAVRQTAENKMNEAWRTAEHGEAELELRAKLENAAKSQELKLTNLSTVRTTKFNNDLSFLELDIAATTALETLTRFIAAVDRIEPKLYWRRMDFRPDNSGAGTIFFSGTLRCLGDARAVAEDNGRKRP